MLVRDSVFDSVLIQNQTCNCQFSDHPLHEELLKQYQAAEQYPGLQEAMMEVWDRWQKKETEKGFRFDFPEHMRVGGSGAWKTYPQKEIFMKFAFTLKMRQIKDKWKWETGRVPIPYTCLVCGSEEAQNWNNFKWGKGCNGCTDVCKPKWDTDSLWLEYFSRQRLISDEWQFINIEEKIPFFCLNCENYHEQTPMQVLRGVQCGKCTNRYSVNINRIKEEWKLLDRVLPEDAEYKNNETKIDFYCNRCNSWQKQSWNKYKQGCGCRGCYEATFLDDEGRELKRLRDQIWARLCPIVDWHLHKLEEDNHYQSACIISEVLFNTYKRSRGYWEHFDHIFPKFIFGEHQLDLMNSPLNLRYLTAYENVRKQEKIWFEDLLNTSEEHLAILAQAEFLPDYAREWLIELGYDYLLSAQKKEPGFNLAPKALQGQVLN